MADNIEGLLNIKSLLNPTKIRPDVPGTTTENKNNDFSKIFPDIAQQDQREMRAPSGDQRVPTSHASSDTIPDAHASPPIPSAVDTSPTSHNNTSSSPPAPSPQHGEDKEKKYNPSYLPEKASSSSASSSSYVSSEGTEEGTEESTEDGSGSEEGTEEGTEDGTEEGSEEDTEDGTEDGTEEGGHKKDPHLRRHSEGDPEVESVHSRPGRERERSSEHGHRGHRHGHRHVSREKTEKQKKEEKRRKKREIMIIFSKHERRGRNVPKFTFHDSLKDMQFALEKFESMIKFDRNIAFYRFTLVGFCFVFENALKLIGHDFGLDGWWKHVKKTVTEYDEYFEEMLKDGPEISPYLHLAGALAMSALSYSALNNVPQLTKLLSSQAGEFFTAMASQTAQQQTAPPTASQMATQMASQMPEHIPSAPAEIHGPKDAQFFLNEINREREREKDKKKKKK